MQALSAVVSDLDGSLLTGSLVGKSLNRISDEDVRTIAALKSHGIPVFLVSGRPYPFVKEVMSQVGFDLPLCGCNGGLIHDFKENKTLFARPMPQEISATVYHFLQERGIPFMLYTAAGVTFSAPNVGRHPHWAAQNLLFQPENRFTARFATDEGFDIKNEQVIKFLLQLGPQDAVTLELKRLFPEGEGISIVSSGKGFLDINDASVHKALGVQELSKLFHFDIARTMGLGDNYNDEEMLRLVGVPVVTENGEEDMKRIASFITTSNNDSPLTHAIRALYPQYL